MDSTRTTFHSIQVLRAIAAVLVVLFHAQGAYLRAGSSEAAPGEVYLFGLGAVGVHIFFVISGFIMVAATPFDPKFDVAKFLKRRILRIYPIYWVCVALYFVGHWVLGAPFGVSVPELVGALLLWPEGATAIIGPAWTLSYEMFFYVCFAAAMGVGLTRGFVLLATAFVGLIFAGSLLQPRWIVLHVVTNSLLLEFIAGVAWGWLLKTGRLPVRAGAGCVMLSVLLFVSGAVYGYDRLPSVLAWGGPSALLILGVVCLEVRYGASKPLRAIGRLGDSSYVLYLIHILLITLVVAFAKANPALLSVNAAVAAVLLAPICIAVAELLHRGLERPLLRYLNPRRSLLPPRHGRRGEQRPAREPG